MVVGVVVVVDKWRWLVRWFVDIRLEGGDLPWLCYWQVYGRIVTGSQRALQKVSESGLGCDLEMLNAKSRIPSAMTWG
jgi:hypothetical protein